MTTREVEVKEPEVEVMNGYKRDANGMMTPVARPGEKDQLAGWIADRAKPTDRKAFVASLRRLPLTTLLTLHAALQAPTSRGPDWDKLSDEGKAVAALLSTDEIEYVRRFSPINAIKSVRSRLGLTLKAAKDVVDVYRGEAVWPVGAETVMELRKLGLLTSGAAK